MKNLTTLLTLACCFFLAASVQATDGNGGWYVSGNSGSGWLKLQGDRTVFDVGGAAGYKLITGTSVESEYGYHRSSHRQSNFTTHAVMANVFQDIDFFDTPIVPYVGGGAGTGWSKLSNGDFNWQNNLGFLWRVMGGVNCSIADRTELGLRYTYAGRELHNVGLSLSRFF